MSDLVARLEAAEAGSRELDAEIATEVLGWKWIEASHVWELPAGSSWSASRSRWGVPAYTSSLDAITALIGEKLPGWSWSVGSDGQAAVSSPPKGHYVAFGTVANTPALALCAALLRALSTQPVSGEVADG